MFELDEDSLLKNEGNSDLEGNPYSHIIRTKLKNEIEETTGLPYIINSRNYDFVNYGAVPKGLLIDHLGVIHGRLEPIIPNDIPRINIDGSGRENINRFEGNEKIFNFKIRLYYNISKPYYETDESDSTSSSTESSEEPTTSEPVNVLKYEEIEDTQVFDVSIRMVKNNDIDNYVFLVGFLLSESSVVNGVTVKHTIKVGNVEYDKNDVMEILKVHPGPFGI